MFNIIYEFDHMDVEFDDGNDVWKTSIPYREMLQSTSFTAFVWDYMINKLKEDA